MIKVHDIARAVARATGLTLDDLKGRSREKPINDARQLVMWLARQITTLSYPAIGRALGGRDHSTALHGAQAVQSRLKLDPQLRALAGTLITHLGSGSETERKVLDALTAAERGESKLAECERQVARSERAIAQAVKLEERQISRALAGEEREIAARECL